MRSLLFTGLVLFLILGLTRNRAFTFPSEDLDSAQKGFVSLFNGKDLMGWEGDTRLWKAEDGMIVGRSPGIRMNQFLATTLSYENFILKLRFRLINDLGNSGVQFRSKRVPKSTEVSGYQAEIAGSMTGSLYDESRRNCFLVDARQGGSEEAVKRDGWNDYVIRCQGNHIVIELNGVKTVDYRETDSTASHSGAIALQVHAGKPMEVQFKDIRIKTFP